MLAAMRLLALCLLLTACNSPFVATGSCRSNSDCPAGGVCVGGTCQGQPGGGTGGIEAGDGGAADGGGTTG